MPPKLQKSKKEPAAKRRLDTTGAAAAATPPRSKRKAEENTMDLTTTTPAKQKRDDSLFTDEQQFKAHALVTPSPKKARRSERKQRQEKVEYVPKYIHKNVEYKRRGEIKDELQVATFELVEKHFVIPDDFETNRKYGPLSGVSFEERAIAAQAVGLLEPKSAESASVKICSACATEGHKRTACPNLV